jgi:5-methylcytosine-specific restriction endonuclease McrA
MTKCLICPSEADEAHHVIPRGRGGEATVPLCNRCHRKITENRPVQLYLLRRKMLAAGLDLESVLYILSKKVRE